ncbi:MAG: flagellar motor switch protein FliM [Lachnospiraceae bacterium]|nr:flagellar motor switch protein FliM [Lachnospiraceae bacterium]
MGEVLSQSEIDSLLNALSTGELDTEELSKKDEKQVRNYDFARPAKFSKEHLRTLEIIYEHYGRLLSTNLPLYLRKSVQITVASSETVVFSEFSNALSNPVILGIVNFAPLQGQIIIELAPNLGFAMIDRMLGGQGVPIDKERDFSDIELVILNKVMIVCMQLMRDPWKNVIDIDPFLERIETNPQFAQIIAPNDMIAIVTLNMKIGDVEGFMNICLPFTTVEDIMDKLNTKFWYSTMKEANDDDYSQNVEAMIRRVDAPVKAVLGNSTITVNDFINLQCGDIIRLDRKADEELTIYVGNIKKFMAMPGKSTDNNYAVRVTQVIREEE